MNTNAGRCDSRVVAVSSLDSQRGHTPGPPERMKTRRRVRGTKYEWQMRVESVIHQMVSGQYYQSHSSPVDERLYRDPTDDIIGDVMSQSYIEKRRSCDLYVRIGNTCMGDLYGTGDLRIHTGWTWLPHLFILPFFVSLYLSFFSLPTLRTALQCSTPESSFCDYRAFLYLLRSMCCILEYIGRIGTDTGCAGRRRLERTV